MNCYCIVTLLSWARHHRYTLIKSLFYKSMLYVSSNLHHIDLRLSIFLFPPVASQSASFILKQYSKNLRVRTQKIKNLLAEICYFNTPKYKNLFTQKNSNRFLYVRLNYFIYNILPKRLSSEIKKNCTVKLKMHNVC